MFKIRVLLAHSAHLGTIFKRTRHVGEQFVSAVGLIQICKHFKRIGSCGNNLPAPKALWISKNPTHLFVPFAWCTSKFLLPFRFELQFFYFPSVWLQFFQIVWLHLVFVTLQMLTVSRPCQTIKIRNLGTEN